MRLTSRIVGGISGRGQRMGGVLLAAGALGLALLVRWLEQRLVLD